MGDYDQISKAFEAMHRAAIIGAWAIFALLLIGLIGGGWLIWYLWHHVAIS